MAARKSAKKTKKKPRKKAKTARRPRALRTQKSSCPGGGRPEIEFPDDCVAMIHLLVGIGAPLSDVATLCEVSKSTLERRAAEEGHPVQLAVSQGMAMRHSKLRLYQWKSAEAGNASMLKWLGMQELDQAERQRLEHTGAGGGPVEIATGDYADLMIAKIMEARRSERHVDIELPAGG